MKLVDKVAKAFRIELDEVRATNEAQDKAVREAVEAARRERLRLQLEIRSHR